MGSPKRRGSKQILLVLVARGTIVLCENSEVSISSTAFTVALLSKIPPDRDAELVNTKQIGDRNYHFHVRVSKGLIYICMTEETVKVMQAQELLSQVERQFLICYGAELPRTALAYSMDDFKIQIKLLIEKFESGQMLSRTENVQRQVDEVTGVMADALGKVITRGEHLDSLVDRSAQLGQKTLQFESQARKLKCEMMVLNFKMTLIIAAIIIVLIVALLLYFCGINFRKCS